MKTCILVATFCLATAAQAAIINFDFLDSPNTDVGSPKIFNVGGYIITATGYTALGGVHLYEKNTGGDEQGLGLINDGSGQDEIVVGSFIQLAFSGLFPSTPFNVTITMNSTTDGEGWNLFQTNSPGATSGTSLLALTNDEGVGHTITHSMTYLDVTSTNGNVLLHSLSFDTGVPEPASMALMGIGLGALALMRRRRS